MQGLKFIKNHSFKLEGFPKVPTRLLIYPKTEQHKKFSDLYVNLKLGPPVEDYINGNYGNDWISFETSILTYSEICFLHKNGVYPDVITYIDNDKRTSANFAVFDIEIINRNSDPIILMAPLSHCEMMSMQFGAWVGRLEGSDPIMKIYKKLKNTKPVFTVNEPTRLDLKGGLKCLVFQWLAFSDEPRCRLEIYDCKGAIERISKIGNEKVSAYEIDDVCGTFT